MKKIYLLKLDGFDVYKIGFTKSKTTKRISELQTGNPYKVKVVAEYETKLASVIETTIHNLYKHKQRNEVLGDENLLGEWFHLKLEEAIGFVELCKKIESNLEFIKGNSTI